MCSIIISKGLNTNIAIPYSSPIVFSTSDKLHTCILYLLSLFRHTVSKTEPGRTLTTFDSFLVATFEVTISEVTLREEVP